MRRRQARVRQAVELSAAAPGSAGGGMEEAEPEAMPAEAPRAVDTGPEGHDDAALAHWRDVSLREPANVLARRKLARILEARGESLLAVEQLEAARAVATEDVDLIIELTQAQTALKRFDPAERELRRALRFWPDNAALHLGLGVISFRRGLYAQAEIELKRVLELDADNGTAYFYRGEALNQVSRVDEALEMLERATQLQPSNARAWYVMGILYDKKGRPQEAGTMYRKAREAGSA